MKRMEVHSHTEYSNIRLLDCINKPKLLIERAMEIGLSGIAITDHECLASHIQVNKMAQEIAKENPEFKVALGNEIYLTDTRESGIRYYHFILIAKDKIGHKQLRQLSSRAWMNSYWDRGMERVPTLKSDLTEIIAAAPGHVIAATACIGGELSASVLEMEKARQMSDQYTAAAKYQQIISFLDYCKGLFGDDFYIECAPAANKEQIIVNKKLVDIAAAYGIKMVIGSDAHYLKKEDRFVHKAYLNSKGGEREVDMFYEYAYLQDEDQIRENLASSIETSNIDKMFDNSMEIWNKIEIYDLTHPQTIPKVDVKDYPKKEWTEEEKTSYPVLNSMLVSDNAHERYWVNQCLDKLVEIDKYNDTYISRLEEEADIKRTIGEKLGTNMFSYPITLQHYIDMFWDCGSLVGAGRGSSCAGLNHYLLGITQLDPIEWELPFFRYINKERVELGDIDIDLCPSKKKMIVGKIKEERGQKFYGGIDDLSRKNLGCVLIATFGTEGTKSAILTAARGYRSEDFPDGIDNDEAQFLASLIPSERGFLWEIDDVLYGNKDKGRAPVQAFINEVNQYPGLLEIIKGIIGLINKRSSHASGVIFADEDPYEFGCYMRTPKGEIITQYDLHDCEAAGMTKYDFLVTEVQDKLAQAIRFLQEDGCIEKDLTLRQVYDKYFHPSVLPIKDERTWEAIQKGEVLNVFQFDSDIGSQAAKKIKPANMLELADANGLMRLMTAEKNAEPPMEKYVRYKNNIQLWYQEMRMNGLSESEQKILEPYFLKSYGVPPSQEQLMLMLMDENICGFTLKEANAARKVVGKKQMSKIPELREQVLTKAKSPNLGQYVWTYGIGPQMGYSFSIIHALAYSFIGFQTAYIATHWNSVYWNTACLVVNSGSLEDDDDMEYDEDDAPVKKKEAGTDYTKLAKALGEIINQGITVSLVDINESDYGFKPNASENEILFGMKALSNINADVVEKIKGGRPYVSFKDFMNRCQLTKTAMLSLIKAGAFDKLEKEWAAEEGVHPRVLVMTYYLSIACEPKKRLTMQNFNGLVEHNLVPQSLDYEKKVFAFNKYLKKNCKWKEFYKFDQSCVDFYNKYDFNQDYINIVDGVPCIVQTVWDKIYKSVMEKAKSWLVGNQETVLKELNTLLFKEFWAKYAMGSVSAWEMEALCFYYNEHELAHIDTQKYGIENFFDMSTEPEVDKYFKRNGKQIPIFKLTRIAGTVIGKNDTRHSVSLLTTDGVVSVKFTRDYYAMYNRQISEVGADGAKHVIEKGWFGRGNKILVTGFRRDDTFVAKNYKSNGGHQLYKITNVVGRDIELEHNREGMTDE